MAHELHPRGEDEELTEKVRLMIDQLIGEGTKKLHPTQDVPSLGCTTSGVGILDQEEEQHEEEHWFEESAQEARGETGKVARGAALRGGRAMQRRSGMCQ